MVTKYLFSIILLTSPLMRASWDLWSQTLIHLLVLASILILVLKKRFALPFYLSTFLPLYLFLLFCFISIFSSANFYESRNEFFNLLTYLVLFYFAKNTNKKYIVVPIVISGLILSCYGIYQKLTVGGNVSSFMNNPNIFAGYLAGIIFVTFSVSHKKIQIVLLSIFSIALVFTGSVAGLLSVIAGLLFFAYIKKIFIQKKYLVFICTLIAFLLIVKLLEKESFDRVVWWLSASKMILAKPLSGVGLGAFADAYQRYKLSGLNSIYAHNYFLQMASEIGIIGFAAFIWFIVIVFRTKKTSENIPFFAAISAMLMHGIFDYALAVPANSILLWTMLGFCSRSEGINLMYGNSDIFFKNQRAQSRMRDENPRTPFNLLYRNLKVFSKSPRTQSRMRDENPRTPFNLSMWLVAFLVSSAVYSQITIFLASRETAIGKYNLDEKKYEIAKTHFTKAIRYDNKNPQTYLFLSSVYQKYYEITGYKSCLYEAEIELLSAAKLQKYNSQIYFDLYNIARLKGNTKNAIFWLKKTLEMSPKSIYYEKCYETLLKEIYLTTAIKRISG